MQLADQGWCGVASCAKLTPVWGLTSGDAPKALLESSINKTTKLAIYAY